MITTKHSLYIANIYIKLFILNDSFKKKQHKVTFLLSVWDMLDSDEKKKIQDIVLAGKVDKRRLMAERAKARLDW